MGIATDMKNLGEEIIASYDMRVKAVGELVKDTHTTLKGFERDRTKMAAEQAKALDNFVKSLTKDVDGMLKKFRREHKSMSEALSKSLSDFVTDLIKDVGNMMKDLQKTHKQMADNLKTDLEKGETQRLKDFKSMMGGIQKDIDEIETFVAKKLKEFDKGHAEMSEELRKELSSYVRGIVKETTKFLNQCSSEMAQAKRAWGNMSATLGKARRKGGPVGIEAGEKVRTVRKATAGMGKAKRKTTKKGKSHKRKVAVGV